MIAVCLGTGFTCGQLIRMEKYEGRVTKKFSKRIFLHGDDGHFVSRTDEVKISGPYKRGKVIVRIRRNCVCKSKAVSQACLVEVIHATVRSFCTLLP